MVLDGYYPSDIRVRKEAETLSEHHNVFILCCKKNGEKTSEEVHGVKVCRNISYRNNYHKGISDILLSVNYIHKRFKRELSKLSKQITIDVLHTHDLPLAKTVYKFAVKNHIKSVLDLHENYPAALSTWFAWRKSTLIRLKNQFFFRYKKWERYEVKMIQSYDVVIAVVDEMKELFIKKYQTPSQKIKVITNTEKKEFASNFSSCSILSLEKSYEKKFVISYVGGFGPHRGLDTAIKGMIKIKKTIPNALLLLTGPKNKDVNTHLRSLINQLNVEDHVELKDPVPFEQVVTIMQGSDINIIPHVSNEHTENTIPHKLFQILLSKKPLLVSSCRPLKRIVEDEGVGYSFLAGNAEDFAKSVFEIHENYSDALRIAEKGFEKSFRGNLNWEHTSKELLKLYDDLKN